MLLAQHLAEQLTVLGQINRFGRSAQNRDAGGLETRGKGQRGLPTKLDDDALDRTHLLLGFVDFDHVFEGQRFEIQPVGHVVIGGHGLRVAVDHDRVVVLAELLHCVHAGVVELDALSDAVGPGTKDDHGFAVALAQLGFVRIAGVVVRRRRVEFSSAGVNRLVHGSDAVTPAQLADGVLPFVAERAQVCDLHIGETGLLGFAQQTG